MPDHVAKLARTDIGLAQALAVAVVRLNRRLRKERRSDLTPNQAAVLGALRRLGALTLGALAEAEQVKPPTMTRIVNCLADMGYVTRAPHPTDGRQVVISISDDGEQWLAAERKRRDVWLAKRLRELEPGERETLREAVVILERLSTV
ncbi:MarR family winged helix-turn-helix transcriptional regulator [Solicola gregarius]|uniref:MarR family transcriptional regulator n=1 Tax=Solicola gregarius TaxID=2908642 RepID=A0AA46YMN7_9ACTN|nr:MarR family transcriptional regulator [Solicola gregarius]UYM06701.1 MarR family transcriptional regulator [Solicola gregarius]